MRVLKSRGAAVKWREFFGARRSGRVRSPQHLGAQI